MKAILTYHSIDDSGSPVSVSRAAWAAHARWLTSGQIRVLSLDALIAHPHDGPDAVGITFDDGFLNVREAVEGLLQQAVPVTLFIVSGHVGGTNAWGGRPYPGIPTLPLLGWPDLERLTRYDGTIQGHTRSHPVLTGLSAGALDDELDGGREDLRARLGVQSTHLAYPYGALDDAIAARASRSYRFGHTTDFRVMGDGEPAMRLPRLDMYYFQSPGALESWGTPAFRRRLWWIRTRRAIRARIVPTRHT